MLHSRRPAHGLRQQDLLIGAQTHGLPERMAVELAAEPGAPRMPSDPEHDHEAERLRNGVPVEDGLATQCRAWSERLGVRWPEP